MDYFAIDERASHLAVGTALGKASLEEAEDRKVPLARMFATHDTEAIARKLKMTFTHAVDYKSYMMNHHTKKFTV